MKLILVLLLVAGCSDSSPRYKVGDCIRVVTSISIADFYIREIIGDKYIASLAFNYKGVPSYLKHKSVFTFKDIENVDTKKINCYEVE